MSDKGTGRRFQEHTRYDRETIKDWSPDWDKQVSPYKTYPDAEITELPEPDTKGGEPLWKLLAGRRSYRDFSEAKITLAQLGQLLWAGQGITARTRNFVFRSAPSAGALYPVETYVAANHVEGLERGIYHYSVTENALELIEKTDHRERLMKAGLGQSVLYESAATFIWTAVAGRVAWKYGDRAWRYIYLDAGHLAQNVLLAAGGLGLGGCPVGAFFDREMDSLLGLDGEGETTVYLAAVGPKQD